MPCHAFAAHASDAMTKSHFTTSKMLRPLVFSALSEDAERGAFPDPGPVDLQAAARKMTGILPSTPTQNEQGAAFAAP